MVARTVVSGVRWFFVLDFVLGPVAVLAVFVGYAVFMFGAFAAWGGLVPWVVTMPIVGLTWAGIAKGYYRFGRRVVRWARPAPRNAT